MTKDEFDYDWSKGEAESMMEWQQRLIEYNKSKSIETNGKSIEISGLVNCAVTVLLLFIMFSSIVFLIYLACATIMGF